MEARRIVGLLELDDFPGDRLDGAPWLNPTVDCIA
jgi:hypothetical protein